MAKKIANLQELLNNGGIEGDVLDQEVAYLVPPGENFGSIILKVDITLKKNGKKEVLPTVAKCVPPNVITQAIFQTHLTFKNEIHWYSTIIPEFIAFQKECGVEQPADFFQKFYAARISLDPNSDVVDTDGLLLTENLNTSGYKVYDRLKGFNSETAKLIVRKLAIFHAVFIGLRLKKSTEFNTKIRPYIQDSLEIEEPPKDVPNPFAKIFDVLANNAELAPFIPRLKKNIETNNPFEQSVTIDGPWTSVCHNDFWTNNIMINEGPPKKAVILDLQIATYKSVAADVIFFLLSSLEIQTYEEHYEEILRHYYDAFIDTLSQVKVDVGEYSFKEFVGEINYEAEHGQFAHAFNHTLFLMAEKDTEGRKYAAEENSDMIGDATRLINNITEKHWERYRFLILEAVKRNWI